jgi:hypothetical protein
MGLPSAEFLLGQSVFMSNIVKLDSSQGHRVCCGTGLGTRDS